MSAETKHQMYEHSVIDVCNRLHGAYKGSGDWIADDERKALTRWLRWRINSWVETPGDNHAIRAVDISVKNYAFAVLMLALTTEGEKAL